MEQPCNIITVKIRMCPPTQLLMNISFWQITSPACTLTYLSWVQMYKRRMSSYILFFLWCRATNDWWTWSCLRSLQQPPPMSSHNALANHPHWMSYYVQSTAWMVYLKKQQHCHRRKTIPRDRKALCTTVRPIFPLKYYWHIYLNCTHWF